MVLEYGDYAIAVDCGLMFPEMYMLGVDLVIPDLTYLQRLGERFLGFVITHGHEDHLGALPYVLRDLRVPVYATPMAAGLLTEKLREHNLSDTPLHVIRPRKPWQIGPFSIEPVHMTQILLLSDSTNAEREGYTPSERAVRGDLDRVFRNTSGKIFFSTFSSHVHRLTQVIELSQLYGRRIAVVGRSMTNSIKIGTQLGYLEYPPSIFADIGEVNQLDPNKVTLLITGSQGEPLSALIRIAEGGHGQLEMVPDDAVILSSRIIPGNEKSISNMINHITRRGATTYHTHNSDVHVSGHASQEELKIVLRLVRPKYFVPVHGEYRHLAKHRSLAHDVGMSPDSTFLLENGQVLEIDEDGAHREETAQAGRVFVDGKGIGDVEAVVLRDRRHLSSDGLVLAVLAIDQQSGELISGPDLISRGFVLEGASQEYLDRAKGVVIETLQQISPESRADTMEVKEEVRKALKRFFAKTLERRPVIVPFVMEM
ncbi:MAG: ribonuclease J [Deltaproteobacteria bacterium]|nr:ribonuclease J [Deltaproteobacteria bacterium]